MAQCGFTAGTTNIKKACLVCSSGVPSRFTRTNLFEQGKISEVAKWLNCSVVSRIVRDSGLGGLSLPRKSVVRLTDRPEMTLDVFRGRETTIQQQLQPVPVGLRFFPFL